MKIAIIAALGLSVTGLNAAPYYVGETLRQDNNVTLNFQDTIIKDGGTTGVRANLDSANIAAFQLRGAYNVTENIPVTLNVPFYIAGENLTGTSRSALGNLGLGLGWTNSMPTDDKEMTWGYSAALNTFFPTSRKAEGSAVGRANVATDIYRFREKSTTIAPTLGLWLTADMVTVKGNIGYGFTYQTDVTDKNQNSFTGQIGASWHAMSNLDVNLEYNAIAADSAFRGGADRRYYHAIAPSVSGTYENFMGSAYVNFPLDKDTRDITAVAFGANVGYMF